MKRLLVPGLIALALVAFLLALASNPGRASADWLGWRIDTSAAFVFVAVLAFAALVAAAWTGGAWLVRSPSRTARAREETARREGLDRLTRGYLALAAGEPNAAGRLAAEARGVDGAAPMLARLLAAQAAEAEGDDAAAQAAYAALLETPEAQSAARRGLARLAARRAEAPPPPLPAEASPPPADVPLALDR
jgi:HemY protein